MHLLSSHSKWSVEPLLKCAAALENGGQEKIQKSPQFW